jgi:hypothetical protein
MDNPLHMRPPSTSVRWIDRVLCEHHIHIKRGENPTQFLKGTESQQNKGILGWEKKIDWKVSNVTMDL